MSGFSIKAVAMDLDGTLLHIDRTLSAHTLATIKRVSELGILPTIATGRSLDTPRPIQKALCIETTITCYNRACIVYRSGNILCRE